MSEQAETLAIVRLAAAVWDVPVAVVVDCGQYEMEMSAELVAACGLLLSLVGTGVWELKLQPALQEILGPVSVYGEPTSRAICELAQQSAIHLVAPKAGQTLAELQQIRALTEDLLRQYGAALERLGQELLELTAPSPEACAQLLALGVRVDG